MRLLLLVACIESHETPFLKLFVVDEEESMALELSDDAVASPTERPGPVSDVSPTVAQSHATSNAIERFIADFNASDDIAVIPICSSTVSQTGDVS